MSYFGDYGLVKIEVRHAGLVGMKPADFNRILKASWADLATWWIRTCLKKHFTKAGGREYGYLPRRGEAGNPHPRGFWASYTGRKQKLYGHTMPDVLSGWSRSQATKGAKTTSTSKGARATFPLGNLKWRAAKGSRIIPAAEMGLVSREDAAQANRLFNMSLEARLKRAEDLRTQEMYEQSYGAE
jgi:hypothetical protein